MKQLQKALLAQELQQTVVDLSGDALLLRSLLAYNQQDLSRCYNREVFSVCYQRVLEYLEQHAQELQNLSRRF